MRCFRGFVLLVLEYCSTVWCSAADTHLKLLGRVVSLVRFLTVGLCFCNIAHRRSAAVLYGALPVPSVPVRGSHIVILTRLLAAECEEFSITRLLAAEWEEARSPLTVTGDRYC